ncbi:hypothetical protein Kpol_172p1 [Vanderwaltozyma polyspora DSM 70294]|uniref:Uncharacterized protein n=1 Tax=Vanderwaltozyma polyspora (strain ATCC 22028 / DSM 70294 / BCRC 21397 / CBS 2163 / NBRC 10782 / NRRL Y-8283 / UCD 57-17) TaxID=436907 RepID=A7TTS0_VANPO|nr:uncharacterized protein Kpol_172p1 [Vanderwaltozyma polyspora DSM 70294]EDO14336.1 hypothetical protein Kpol_172p1 [Vanderwaltozyma polyspora DSM 70294]
MKLNLVLSTLIAATAVSAKPIYQFGSAATNVSGNGTEPLPSNGNNTNGTHANNTNGTGGPIPGGSISTGGTKLKVIITGGDVPINALSSVSDIDIEVLFNSTDVLNITELYSVANSTNVALDSDEYKGAVIIGNSNSLESLGFFESIVIDSPKAVVVSDNIWQGVIVANSSDISGMDPVVAAFGDKLIYSGVFAPNVDYTGVAKDTGIPLGICNYAGKEAVWFFNDTDTNLLGYDSIIRNNFPQFSAPSMGGNSSTPIVPIVYGGDLPTSLLSSLGSFVQGLVVISNGPAGNLTLTNSPVPIVYAKSGDSISYIGEDEVPAGAISAGYLSPKKAQILLEISLINGVSSSSDLSEIFP